MADAAQQVVVVGSANYDIAAAVESFPRPGETVLGESVNYSLGGKGFNQVVAARLAGAQCAFVACVGSDAPGGRLLDHAAGLGVDVSGVAVDGDVATGTAHIMHTRGGENSIVVIRGANSRLTVKRVEDGMPDLGAASVLVVQGEILPEASVAAVLAARRADARIIVNLAPVIALDAEVLAVCDPLVVNESEAAQLLSWDTEDVRRVPEDAAGRLNGRARSVVITLGDAGAALADSQGRTEHHPVLTRQPVVDTTGAGDAFVGVLAATLSLGRDLSYAVAAAVRAASATVSRRGAAESFPNFAELLTVAGPMSQLGDGRW